MSVFGIVTIMSFVFSMTGAGLLAVLAISLRIQGDSTNRQEWNRRMLAGGGLSYLTGLLLPFAFLSVANATILSISGVILGLLIRDPGFGIFKRVVARAEQTGIVADTARQAVDCVGWRAVGPGGVGLA